MTQTILALHGRPTGRGIFDPRAKAVLRVYAEWMHLHVRAIYGCTQSDFTPPSDVRYTQNGDRLYAHIFAWPFKHLQLPGLAGKIRYAQLLHDASEITFKEPEQDREYDEEPYGPDSLALTLLVIRPDVVVPVVELFLK